MYVCMYIPIRDVTINREGKGRPLMWDSDTTTYKTIRSGDSVQAGRVQCSYLLEDTCVVLVPFANTEH